MGEQRKQMSEYYSQQRVERLSLSKRKTEEGMLKSRDFTWNRKEFEWRKIYHALLGGIGGTAEGSMITEAFIGPMPMKMYTDHRVMGQVVLPGVSHVSLMAATGCVGFPQPMGRIGGDYHMNIKEVLFERPYVVHGGAE